MMDFPSIEYDDCYPEDEEFLAFNDVPLSFEKAARWLLEELPRAEQHMTCFCSVVDDFCDDAGRPCYKIAFSTGGWSGAESIISLIERRVDMGHFMASWRRGGHYTFEIPMHLVAKATSASGQDQNAASAVGETDLP